MPLAYPVVLVPGITASSLRDEYGLPPETVWAALTKEYERVALHPDNLRYETIEPARIAPDTVLEIAYKELIEELRYNLREQQDQSVPVFPFAYDWRQPLETTEAQLAEFVDEVIDRTRLLRHYRQAGFDANPRVNLVGHSMGGLVIAGYLARIGDKARVSKVATLATPFRGSFEAVIQITTGTANLGSHAPSSRERETSRLTPALYHLIPSCTGLTVNPPLPPKDLFEPTLWQPSIVKTLQEYVRLYAADPTGAGQQAAKLFSSLLSDAGKHRARIENFKPADAGLGPDDWLCVAGVNSKTRVRLNVVPAADGTPEFNLQSADRDDQWNETDAIKSPLTGDGTVPFPGAVANFIPIESIVCVTPDDYGSWELQDRLTTKVGGFHGILPNMDMLHRLLVRFFTGRPDGRKNTWGRSAPGVAKADWKPPLALDHEPK